MKAGLATRNKTSGQITLKPLPPKAVSMFLGESDKSSSTLKLDPIEKKLLDIAIHEFKVRDFSTYNDEAILKYVPLLRERLPSLFSHSQPHSHDPLARQQKFPHPLLGLEPEYPPAPPLLASQCMESGEGELMVGQGVVGGVVHSDGSTSTTPQPSSVRLRAGSKGLSEGGIGGLDHAPVNTYRLSHRSFMVHLHIPKTGGTNFNLQLKSISNEVKGRYCEVGCGLRERMDQSTHRVPRLTGLHNQCTSFASPWLAGDAQRLRGPLRRVRFVNHPRHQQGPQASRDRAGGEEVPGASLPRHHHAEGPHRPHCLPVRAPHQPR